MIIIVGKYSEKIFAWQFFNRKLYSIIIDKIVISVTLEHKINLKLFLQNVSIYIFYPNKK